MALVKCKDCTKEFSTDAKKCPGCGAKKPPKDRSALYKGIAIFFALGGLLQIMNPHNQISEPQEDKEKMPISASAACIIAQDAIKTLLRAPSTAEFPSCGYGLSEYDIRISSNRAIILVNGYVDAQNSFGAMLRSPWSAQLKRADIGSKEFVVVKVNFEGKTVPFK